MNLHEPASRPLTSRRWLVATAGCLLGACCLEVGTPRPASAQPSLMGTASNFTMSEYYDAPHETQMKSLISGTEAEPRADGRLLVKGLRLETFRENGDLEMQIKAPQCIYDRARRLATSPDRLTVRSGDGRFVVEGVGFLWRQDASTLMISNRVHTIVYPIASTLKKR